MKTHKDIDGKGNKYLNSYFTEKEKAIVSVDGKNRVFSGTPKIVLRNGDNSPYGNEMVFQFLIDKEGMSYPSNSKHSTIEFYIKDRKGIEFLKQTIKFFEENDKGVKEDGV